MNRAIDEGRLTLVPAEQFITEASMPSKAPVSVSLYLDGLLVRRST